MRRMLSALIVLSLTVGVAPLHAATKAGEKCTVLGQKKSVSGTEFTCVKSEKKLVWNKGVKESKFEPWSTPSNQSQEIATFREKVNQWFNSKQSHTAGLEVYIDPAINPSGADWVTKALTFEANYIGFPSPFRYKAYIGKTDQWVISKRKEVMPGLQNWNPKFVCYEDLNEACAYPASKELTFVWSTSNLSAPDENWQFTRSLGHEFFHLTQCDFIGLPEKCGEYFNKIPSWMAEGGPNLIGSIFMDRLGYLKYEEQRRITLANYKNGRFGGNYPLSAFSQNIRNGELNPYEIGMLACEYLVASAGLQSFLDFHSNLAKASDFEEAFRRSFGISVSDFYTAFDKAREKIGFYPVTQK